jgi:prephenate dehydratase
VARLDQREVGAPIKMASPGRLAYLGPAGTFTEEAAFRHNPHAELLPCPTIPAVAAAVRNGDADQGIAPVENSLQGAVTDTLDLLIHEQGVSICNELVLPIVHNLLVKPGTVLSQVRVVYSHPQALGQCRAYLGRHVPHAELRAALSTAAAVDEMQRSAVAAAAIAPQRSAELYGAQVLATGVQDSPNNATRFLVLATHDHPRTGHDKTSICLSFADDRPGLLFGVMREFAERGINLSKVESRPTREGLGQYYFLIDLEGHREDIGIREALDRVAQSTTLLKVFGSYPRFAGP